MVVGVRLPGAAPSVGSAVVDPAGCVVTRGRRLQFAAIAAGRGVGAHPHAPARPPEVARTLEGARGAVSSECALWCGPLAAPSRSRPRDGHRGDLASWRDASSRAVAASLAAVHRAAAGLVVVALLAAACDTGAPAGTPPITPGTSGDAARGQRGHARLRVRPVGRRPRARRDGPAARDQLRPREPRGGRSGRSTTSWPGRPPRRRPSARRRARRRSSAAARLRGHPGRRRVRAAGRRHLDGPGRRGVRARAAGSSAATSPATGRRGWSCRCGWSGRTGVPLGTAAAAAVDRRPRRLSAPGPATRPLPSRLDRSRPTEPAMPRGGAGGTLLRREPVARGPRPRTLRESLRIMAYVIAEPCIDVLDESVRLRLPGGLHPLRCRHRPHALDRPQRVHRLRRLRARVPGERDLPRGEPPAGVGAVHADQRGLVHRQGGGPRAEVDELKPA